MAEKEWENNRLEKTKLHEIETIQEQVILVGVATADEREAEESLDELEELAKTAGAVTVGKVIQNRESIHPGTYVGSGKIQELKAMIA